MAVVHHYDLIVCGLQRCPLRSALGGSLRRPREHNLHWVPPVSQAGRRGSESPCPLQIHSRPWTRVLGCRRRCTGGAISHHHRHPNWRCLSRVALTFVPLLLRTAPKRC
jgi:hypothetical protein